MIILLGDMMVESLLSWAMPKYTSRFGYLNEAAFWALNERVILAHSLEWLMHSSNLKTAISESATATF